MDNWTYFQAFQLHLRRTTVTWNTVKVMWAQEEEMQTKNNGILQKWNLDSFMANGGLNALQQQV